MKLFQFAGRVIRKYLDSAKTILERIKYKLIAIGYDFNGYKRIYLVHIRKTGGTSLNNMFLSLTGEDSNALYEQLARTADHRILSNGLIYVGWNIRYINEGNYFYAFSHTPIHQLDLPKRTFTVCCFRDPVKRVISHYNMLMDYHVNKIDNPCMATEGKWLGEGFVDFLGNIPKEHLLNQLYMFSKDFNIDEAVENVRQLSHYFFSVEFDKGIAGLNMKTNLNLRPIHIRKAEYQSQISEHSLAKLRQMLDKEYRFLDRVREIRGA